MLSSDLLGQWPPLLVPPSHLTHDTPLSTCITGLNLFEMLRPVHTLPQAAGRGPRAAGRTELNIFQLSLCFH